MPRPTRWHELAEGAVAPGSAPERQTKRQPKRRLRGLRRPLVAGLVVYALLLAASHAVRWRARSNDGPVRSGIELPEASSDRPIVVLLHGSPGSGRDFDALIDSLRAELGPGFDLWAPDLLGFGSNRARVEDYSIRAQAGYVSRALEGRGHVHLVGFSLGGGAALEFVDRSPGAVESIVLLASIGRQEFELLGDYSINHLLHGVQWLGLLALHEGVPHFGWLDGFPLDVGYARSFYDTDQRPLAEIAAEVEPPVLIIHGRHDPLVPFGVAVEHHRAIPHSELVALDSDHFDLFRRPEFLATEIADFIRRAEEGSARTRRVASAERVAAAAEPFDPGVIPPASGLGRWIWIALIAVATFVSDDLATISSGLLVSQARISYGTAVLACFLGILIGDVLLFWAGRWLGRLWVRRRPLRWLLSESRLDEASDWFRRRGPIVIFLSRFTPGMRLPTYVAAGILETSFWRCLGYFAIAVGVWSPVVVWLTSRSGELAFRGMAGSAIGSAWLFALLVVVLWAVLSAIRTLASAAGRRRARWWLRTLRQRFRWEFWPLQILYAPVVLYVLLLALRHRSLTLFTAANPGMPDGGFVGESKSEILGKLPPAAVAPFGLVPGELDRASRRQRIEEFLGQHGFPIVLKPDVGERGQGVSIVRRREEIDRYLESFDGSAIVQAFVDGPELGVFYVRPPGQSRGRIFSITEKLLPEVVGDGTSTVEELIYLGERTAPRADLLLALAATRRSTVPAVGERVPLVELGTHCRGAIFDDGERFLTEELEAAVDEISRAYEGFSFGRYDLRAPSHEALREGRDLRVLELNGVTSEATNIYDRRYGLLDAYKILFEQWRLAFEIGADHRKLGASPSTVRELLSRIVRSFG